MILRMNKAYFSTHFLIIVFLYILEISLAIPRKTSLMNNKKELIHQPSIGSPPSPEALNIFGNNFFPNRKLLTIFRTDFSDIKKYFACYTSVLNSNSVSIYLFVWNVHGLYFRSNQKTLIHTGFYILTKNFSSFSINQAFFVI